MPFFLCNVLVLVVWGTAIYAAMGATFAVAWLVVVCLGASLAGVALILLGPDGPRMKRES